MIEFRSEYLKSNLTWSLRVDLIIAIDDMEGTGETFHDDALDFGSCEIVDSSSSQIIL